MKDFSVLVRNAAVEGTADGLRRGGLDRGNGTDSLGGGRMCISPGEL